MRRRDPTAVDWKAGLLTGLVTSTFSSVVVTLGSRRIGRDAPVDWMELGSILIRRRAIRKEPRPVPIAAGLLVHQAADVFWATVWGCYAGRLHRGGQRVTIALWMPWALATAAVEYYLLLPWLQPLVRMQVPYWTASFVHMTSGAAYPVLPWVRQRLTGRQEDGVEGARRAALALAAGTALLGAVTVMGRVGREPHWPWLREADREFLELMHSHHEIGVQLSERCARKSASPKLRTLGRLMYAEHISELEVMRSWWRSWYAGDVPEPTDEQHREMPGMPLPGVLEELERLEGRDFERRFVRVMIDHHLGAVEMANDAWKAAGDPRIKLFADAIRHAQAGQIERMARHA